MTNKSCKDCKYSRTLKHYFKLGTGHEYGMCCTALAKDKDDGFVLEVEPDSYCEMLYCEKR